MSLRPRLCLAAALGACAAPAGAVAPSRTYATTPAALKLPFEAVTLVTADAESLSAWWFPGPPGAAVVVLAGPGEGNQADLLPAVQELRRRGFAALTFDYRGFGPRGTGSPDTLRRLLYSSGYARDMAAALAWARARGGPQGRVFAYGRGMGSAAAVAACARRGDADGVVADGLFRDLRGYLRATGLDQDPRAVEVNRRNVLEADEPLSATLRLRSPLFAIFSGRDELMPESEGVVAARQVRIRVDLWTVPEAGHGEAHRVAPDYYDRIARWMKRLAAIPKAG